MARVNRKASSSNNANPQMVDENSEIVSKAELVEMRTYKRKWQEAEPKLQKLMKLEALVADNVVFRPAREKIIMTLPKSSKVFTQLVNDAQKEIEICSEPKEVAGFNWKLQAVKKAEHPNFLGLHLWTFPPENYKGSYEFDVKFSIRVLNVSSPKDIQKETKNKKFKNSDGRGWGWGFEEFVETKKLLDPASGFLQGNGIKVEVDFTVNTATLDHFLADDSENDDEDELAQRADSNDEEGNSDEEGEEID